MIYWKKQAILAIATVLFQISTIPGAEQLPNGWQPYAKRYAIVVMAKKGHRCYFGTCNQMYKVLIEDYGFKKENVRLYSTQEMLDKHPEVVYSTSTKINLLDAYAWVQSVCTEKDLFYIYWVDHGSKSGFSIIDGEMKHSELAKLMAPIKAKVIIGAYNPCHSGCIIDDVSRSGVISATSTNCRTENAWSWAENWWASIMKHEDGQKYVSRCPTTMSSTDIIADTDGDGVINMLEAYVWTAKIGGKREGTSLDANGDRKGSRFDKDEIDPSKVGSDAYIAKHYSLNGWKPIKQDK